MKKVKNLVDKIYDNVDENNISNFNYNGSSYSINCSDNNFVYRMSKLIVNHMI